MTIKNAFKAIVNKVVKQKRHLNVYEARAIGREVCATEGSHHYKEGGLEPVDLMMSKGVIEDFCIGNMIKYATRFKVTRNIDDLKKVADYAHILAGYEANKASVQEIVSAQGEQS